MDVREYLSKIIDFPSFSGEKQVDYLAYYLQINKHKNFYGAKDINEAFLEIPMTPYSRTASYLSEQSGKKSGRHVKMGKGYTLNNWVKDEIKKVIDSEPQRQKIADTLLDLKAKITDSQEISFVEEAISCYGIGANRASVVMVWCLVLSHLRRYVYAKELANFNLTVPKRFPKITVQVGKQEDFSKLGDEDFIEILKTANIIDVDEKKILLEKLGIRNSAAHPSSVKILASKTNEFIEDLLSNIILKPKFNP